MPGVEVGVFGVGEPPVQAATRPSPDLNPVGWSACSYLRLPLARCAHDQARRAAGLLDERQLKILISEETST